MVYLFYFTIRANLLVQKFVIRHFVSAAISYKLMKLIICNLIVYVYLSCRLKEPENKVLRYSVTHFLSNSQCIACWVAVIRERKKNIKHIILLARIETTTMAFVVAHSRVGRGNLTLRSSVPHFPPNSGGIASTPERRNGNINENKYLFLRVEIETTISRVYTHTMCPCATTGLEKVVLNKYVNVVTKYIYFSIFIHNMWCNTLINNTHNKLYITLIRRSNCNNINKSWKISCQNVISLECYEICK